MDRFANNYDPSVTTPCSDCCEYGESESIDLGFTSRSSMMRPNNNLPGLAPGGGLGRGLGDGPRGDDGLPIDWSDLIGKDGDCSLSSVNCIENPCLTNPNTIWCNGNGDTGGGGGTTCTNGLYVPGSINCSNGYQPSAGLNVASCCVVIPTGGGTGGGGCGFPGECLNPNSSDYGAIGCGSGFCLSDIEDEEPDNTSPVSFTQMTLCIGDTGYETLRSEDPSIPDGWWGTNSSTTDGSIDTYQSGAGFNKYFDDLMEKNGRLDMILSNSLNTSNSDKLKTYFREIQIQKPNKRVFVNPTNLLPFIYGYTDDYVNNLLDTSSILYIARNICTGIGGEGIVITYTPPQNQVFTLPNETFFACLCDAPEPEEPTSCEDLGCPEGFQCLNGECVPIPDPTQGCRSQYYWDYFYNRS